MVTNYQDDNNRRSHSGKSLETAHWSCWLRRSGVVVLASMPAFVFSRMRFRGRECAVQLLHLGLLFPITVAILPLYITLRQANLVDSLWGIILPQVAFGLPGNILILRGFFAAVPVELEEAAIHRRLHATSAFSGACCCRWCALPWPP